MIMLRVTTFSMIVIQAMILILIVMCNTLNGMLVNDVTADNINEFIRNSDEFILQFTMPVCVQCRLFDTIFNDAANEILSDYAIDSKNNCSTGINNGSSSSVSSCGGIGTKPIQFGSCNALEHPSVTAQFDVINAPTVFVYKGKRIYQYKGEFTKHAIIEYIKYNYVDDTPISWMSSPISYMGKMKGCLIFVGIKVMNSFGPVTINHLGLPHWIGFAAVITTIACSILFTSLIIVSSVVKYAKDDF